jgi:hypothetical protein
MIASHRPAMDFAPDSGGEAVGRDYSFQEAEQTMDTTEGEDCGRPSKENGEEGEGNLFEEERDLEGTRLSPILEDVIGHINDSHSLGRSNSNRRTSTSTSVCLKGPPGQTQV